MGSIAGNKRSVNQKTAIVTGAGTGINLEFAKILLENGCNVVIGDLSLQPEAEKILEKYNSGSPRALFQKTDATSWKQLGELFKITEQKFGSYDIVCPGAGIFEPPFSSFWYPPGSERSRDDPLGDRYAQIDLNLVHPIRATQMAISHFLSPGKEASQSNPKTVVHISSIASEAAYAPVAVYNATKWGLRGFIYAMGELEESKHIRVAGVAPAIVRTRLWTDAEDKKGAIEDKTGKEQDEWTTPEEVAEVMYKICTEDSISMADGTQVPIKGGSLIEVGHQDVRDVPLLCSTPAGTGTLGKGYAMANPEKMWGDMYGALAQPGWGTF